ncbi:MAG: discoidin domain-containing protein [Candidatus Poribacteria bacterium]|jgi:hypothetical protein|nr:discoidin domain-containing protein [Candidatus Poribacteria bacterium]MDP6961828.1 discoidin domain-containing protein [Dehalococcoidia bacterium]
MNLKYVLLGGIAILLGFLFYPRSSANYTLGQSLIPPVRILDNEPLRLTDLIRSNPPYATFDLGYVYKIDKAQVAFENPEESGPRQFDLLVKTAPGKQGYHRVYSYIGNSREYGYPLQSFQIPTEARWVQIVINDWFSNKPNLQKDQFRIGTRYQQHSLIVAAKSTHNSKSLHHLIDLLPTSKWTAAGRVVIDKESAGQAEPELTFRTPTLGGKPTTVTVTVDLGRVQNIYGTRVTTDGPGNNLKRYQLAISSGGTASVQNIASRDFEPFYQSETLPDETVIDLHLLEKGRRGRYIQLQIRPGDWYGDYAEIRELEVFTDNHRLLPSQLPENSSYRQLADYTATQMEYENLGADNNRYAPHLRQGFAFDRLTADPQTRYFLPEGEEPGSVSAGNTPEQKSFAYHYDTVEIHYDRLKPWMLYWIQVEYLQGNGGQRIQNLLADQFLLHDALEIPKGQAKQYIFQIPTQAYAGELPTGEVTLRFNRLAGANAVVSTVSLLESRPMTSRELASNPLSSGTTNQLGRSIRADGEIVIDGKADDWHLLYPLEPGFPLGLEKNNRDSSLKELSVSPIALNNKIPLRVYTQWNEDNFYVLATFLQSSKQLLATQHHTLHLFIDSQRTGSPGMYTQTDHHFEFELSNLSTQKPQVYISQIHHHLDAIPKTIGNYQEVEAVLRSMERRIPDQTDKQQNRVQPGYNLEIRFPKESVLKKFQAGIGHAVGLNYILQRIDKTEANQLPVIAFATADLQSPPQAWFPIEMVSRISGEVIFMDKRATLPIFSFVAGDTISLCTWDADRNSNRSISESISVRLKNKGTGETLDLMLSEVDYAFFVDDDPSNDPSTNSSLFAIKIETAFDVRAVREKANSSVDAALPVENPKLHVWGSDQISMTYIDPYFSRTERDKPVTATISVESGNDGKIYFGQANGQPIDQLEAGTDLFLFADDLDLKNSQLNEFSIQLTVQSPPDRPKNESLSGVDPTTRDSGRVERKEPQQEKITVVLVSVGTEIQAEDDADSSGATQIGDTVPEALVSKEKELDRRLFRGKITTVYEPNSVSNDDLLQIVGGQIIEATYLDNLQSTGQPSVKVKTQVIVKTGQTAQLSVTSGPKLIAGNPFRIQLIDADLDTDATKRESAIVEIRTQVKIGPVLQLRLHETDVGIFTAECQTIFGDARATVLTPANAKNPILPIKGGDQIVIHYLDQLQVTGQTQQHVVAMITVRTGHDGNLAITEADYVTEMKQFRAGETLYFRLRDPDLVDPGVEITVTDDLVGDREQVILYKLASGDNFLGMISTAYLADPAEALHATSLHLPGSVVVANNVGNTVEDGILQVRGASIVRVNYVDQLRATGQPLVSLEDQAKVQVGTTATLAAYTPSKGDNLQMTNATAIPARPSSTGMSHTTSLLPTDQANTQIGTSDVLQSTITHFRAGQSLILEISDDDILQLLENRINQSIDYATVVEMDANQDTVRDRIRLKISEGNDQGVFRHLIPTRYSETPVAPATGWDDDILQVYGGGVVRLTYVDDLQASGATQVPIHLDLLVDVGETAQLEVYNLETGRLISSNQVGIGGFEIGENLQVVLKDGDLNILDNQTETTTVTINLSEQQVQLKLQETTDGVFSAMIGTVYKTEIKDAKAYASIPNSLSLLNITDRETISIQYLDALTATGQTNVTVTSEVVVLSGHQGILKIVEPVHTIDHSANVDLRQTQPIAEIATVRAGEVIGIWLEDPLLDIGIKINQVPITVVSDVTKDSLDLMLRSLNHENQRRKQTDGMTRPLDGVYVGNVATRYGSTPIADQTLDVQGGETIRVIYQPELSSGTIIEDSTLVTKGNSGYLEIVTENGTSIRNFNIGTRLYFRVKDPDLNQDPHVVDRTSIVLLVDGIETKQQIEMIEEEQDSNRFRGSIETFYGKQFLASAPQNLLNTTIKEMVSPLKKLALVGGEIITARYMDLLAGSGETNVPLTMYCRCNLQAIARYTEQHVIVDGFNDKWPLENALRTAKDEALLWLQWDNDALYFLAQVQDRDIQVPDPIEYFQGADALELHLDLAPDAMEKPAYLQNRIWSRLHSQVQAPVDQSAKTEVSADSPYIFWFCPKGGGFKGQKPYMGQAQPKLIPNYQAKGLRFAVRQRESSGQDRESYYTIEGRIPFFPLLPQFDPLKTKRNLRLGFNFVVYRSDDQAIQWANPIAGTESFFPSDLGLLVLNPSQ